MPLGCGRGNVVRVLGKTDDGFRVVTGELAGGEIPEAALLKGYGSIVGTADPVVDLIKVDEAMVDGVATRMVEEVAAATEAVA